MLARRSRPSPFLPITSLQPQHYHGITHSFAQRQPSIPPIFNSFRTLSVASGVVPPGYQNPEEHRLCGLCAPISVPSVLRFFPHLLAVICATWRPYPLWTHSVAHTSRHHGGCPHNPYASFRIQSSCSATVANAMAQPDRPVGSQSNPERCNRDA